MGLGKVQGQDDNVRVNGLRQSVGVASRTVPETGKTIIIEFMWFVMTCKRQVIRLLPSPASAIQYTGRRQVAGDTVYLQQQARVRRHSSVLTAEQRANAVLCRRDVRRAAVYRQATDHVTAFPNLSYRHLRCSQSRRMNGTVTWAQVNIRDKRENERCIRRSVLNAHSTRFRPRVKSAFLS